MGAISGAIRVRLKHIRLLAANLHLKLCLDLFVFSIISLSLRLTAYEKHTHTHTQCINTRVINVFNRKLFVRRDGGTPHRHRASQLFAISATLMALGAT